MPEFSVHILKKVIQLIYDDYVLLDSESEAKSVQETMKILEIFPGAGGPVVAKTVLKDQLQVKCFLPSEKVLEIGRNNEARGLPRTDFQKNESKNENKVGKNLNQVSPAPSSHHQLPSARQPSSVTPKLVPVVPQTVPVAQNSMPVKPISIPHKSPMLPVSIKLPPQSTTQNAKSPEPKNSAFPRESVAIALVRPETVPMETEEAIKKPKTQDHVPRNTQKNAMPTSAPYQVSAPIVPVTASSGSEIVPVITKPVDDQNRIPTKTENPARDVRRAAHPVSNPSSFIPVAPKNAQNSEFPPATEPRMPRNVVPTPSEDTDPGTDAEMDYNDLDRFLQRARSCQKCKSVYTSAGTATSCLASHNGRVRCYFCFRVCRSKIQLFDHYKRVHQKPGDLANTVVCPYCGQVIPFLAVSCHVVAVHILSDQSSKKTIVKSEPVIVKQKPPPPPPVISPTPQQQQSPIDPGIMKTEIRNENVCDIKDNTDYSVRTLTNNGKEYVVVLHKPKAHPL